VFGYRYAPIEGGPPDYTTFDLGGDPLGGMGGMLGAHEGTPSHWVAYFCVATPMSPSPPHVSTTPRW